MDMQKIANEYQKKHRGKGRVTKVTDYSFWWETLPNPKKLDEKTKTTVFYTSYFIEV